MELTREQKQALYDNGFVKLPGVVPGEMVDAALRSINSSLGTQGIHPDHLTRFRAQSYCPELQGTPPITDLLNNTPVWSIAESAIGVGKLQPVTRGQIALRFPTMDQPAHPRPHLDG